MKKKFLSGAFGALMIPLALVSCSNSDEPTNVGDNASDSKGKFVFATTVQGSNATSYVLLTGESLDEGTRSFEYFPRCGNPSEGKCVDTSEDV